MPNSLNIDTTKFGPNSEKFFLYDPALYLDFHDNNGQVAIGYLEAKKSWKQKVDYVAFETGIPKSEIRRDVIKQSFTLEGVIKQFQKETLALVMQRKIDSSDGTYDRVIIGSKVPAAIFPSAVLVGQTADGGDLRLWIRRLQITAEDLEIMLGGDEYSSIPFKGTAQKDEAPQTTNPTWPFASGSAEEDNIAFWSWRKADPST